MTDPELRLATYRYEHTEALFDGSVGVEGFRTDRRTAGIASEIFRGMLTGEYDVAELGLTYLARVWEQGEFLALPVFPNRNFRHSAVFVRADSGIERPGDLVGRTVGEFALWGHDPGVWIKGILADEFDVRPEQCSWVVGGTNTPVPEFDWVPQPVPAGIEVRHAGPDRTLTSLLLAGEIDGLVSVDVPQEFLDGDPRIRRLWVDHEVVERDYHRRTGIFPMMHVVAIRSEFLRAHPGAARAVFDAFLTAKEERATYYRDQATKQHMGLMTPWFSALFAENRRQFGEDWWPYGVDRNRKAVDTFLRYAHEQGLTRTALRSEDVFVPDLLDT